MYAEKSLVDRRRWVNLAQGFLERLYDQCGGNFLKNTFRCTAQFSPPPPLPYRLSLVMHRKADPSVNPLLRSAEDR